MPKPQQAKVGGAAVSLEIAHLITGSASMGGAQTHVRDLTLGLQALGHRCTVMVGPPDGLFCDQLRHNHIPVQILRSLEKAISPLRDSRALLEVIHALRRRKPDLVAVHTAKASLLGRVAASLLGIPCVFTPHGLSIVDRRTGKPHPVFLAIERTAGRLAKRIITVSAHERQLAEYWQIAPAHKLKTVYNGIPVDAPLSDPSREPVNVIMVARFDAPKDQSTLLRALAELVALPWTVRFVGSGSALDQARKLSTHLGLAARCEFLGERADIPVLLGDAQIFVLSSQLEAFPISILEAMRAGLPVIASRVGGIPEAVDENRTGFLTPASDHRALAAKLFALLRDPVLRKTFGRNGRDRFLEKFSLSKMVAHTLAVYEEALSVGTGQTAAAQDVLLEPLSLPRSVR